MKIQLSVITAFFFNLSITATLVQGLVDRDERKPYIVYMGDVSPNARPTKLMDEHHTLLTDATGDASIARESKIYSYKRSFNGFAARLLPQEADKLLENEGVVSVFPNTMRPLLTTRSWEFLGMPEDLKQRNTLLESNTIVGVLDTGIYVDAPSFNDQGYGPPPSKWKGKCDKGANFTGCNRKVIGARFYNVDKEDTGMDPTPVDTDGHGTHTASTAAGASVKGASLYGLASGTARGGVPSARIAMYKVCSEMGCADMNLLAGFDDAIADGVDMISVSIGGPRKRFFNDVVAIGGFHAMKRGILTVCAGGNSGPSEGTIQNVAPWVLTVGASNMDREFRTSVKLGDGEEYTGISINTFSPKKQMYPLTSGTLAYNNSNPYLNGSSCDTGSLSQNKVKGRIVLCQGWSAADYSVKKSGGAGTIIALDKVSDVASTNLIPTAMVTSRSGMKIARYINTTKFATALISKSTTVNATAPVIASFSSRGPQNVARNILKPDIAAPGLDILAAYSKLVSITNEQMDKRFNYFNIVSGTSMACPHVSGAAAYVKTFHPDWSPAAIKSALMTTARPVRPNNTEDPLSSGSGLLNPVQAVHPGLVYDLTMNDYIRYLCREGYNGSEIALITGNKRREFNCTKFRPAKGTDGLNYPSMHAQLQIYDTIIDVVFYRTVTHVGFGPSVYKATVDAPKELNIKVVPSTLSFTKPHQKQSFTVMVKGRLSQGPVSLPPAFLTWDDTRHAVRSPILVYKATMEDAFD